MKLPAILSRSPKGGGGGGRGSVFSSGSKPSKGSSSSSKPSNGKGGAPIVVYNNGGGQSKLPWWAILLIVYFSLLFTIFMIALIHYCYKERRRKKDNKPFRAGHAVWKAFCAASGLWLVVWLAKRCRRRRKDKRGALARSGTYSKIEEGPSHDGEDRSSGIQTPAQQPHPYAHGGGTYLGAAVEAKYEPLGHYQQREPPPMITGPIEQTSAIPLPSPTASPAPSAVSAMTAPPPYTGPPAAPAAVGPGVYKPSHQPDSVIQAPRPIPYHAAAHPLFGPSSQ